MTKIYADVFTMKINTIFWLLKNDEVFHLPLVEHDKHIVKSYMLKKDKEILTYESCN